VQPRGPNADKPEVIDNWLLACILIPIVVLLSWWRWVTYKRDPTWEMRWQELSPEERERLAEAARLKMTSEEPEEAWLIEGSARFQEHFLFNAPWKRMLSLAAAFAAVFALVVIYRVLG